jgi:CTP synthase
MLLCRSAQPMSEGLRQKLSLFCSVPTKSVIVAEDVSTIYEVPRMFRAQQVDDIVLEHFNLTAPEPQLADWDKMLEVIHNPARSVNIAICGKYVNLKPMPK